MTTEAPERAKKRRCAVPGCERTPTNKVTTIGGVTTEVCRNHAVVGARISLDATGVAVVDTVLSTEEMRSLYEDDRGVRADAEGAERGAG